MRVERRISGRVVALETTLLAHGVPGDRAEPLRVAMERAVVEGSGGTAHGAVVGVVDGRAVVGMSAEEVGAMVRAGVAGRVAKLNTANLGLALSRGETGATTVSATMEIAASGGVRVFATGGLGGVHHRRGADDPLDVSSDLLALARFPVCVVCSGVKAILDVVSSREALETLGVPVLGWKTDAFPAFYLRESGAGVDARFDDEDELCAFVRGELARSGRGIVVANPPPEDAAIDVGRWKEWLGEAEGVVRKSGASGRGVTPAVLSALHELSGGATLRANEALVVSNARLAGMIAGRV